MRTTEHGPAPPWLGLLSFSPQQSECDREHRYPHRNRTRGRLTMHYNFRVNERTLKRALATPQSAYSKAH